MNDVIINSMEDIEKYFNKITDVKYSGLEFYQVNPDGKSYTFLTDSIDDECKGQSFEFASNEEFGYDEPGKIYAFAWGLARFKGFDSFKEIYDELEKTGYISF